MTFLPILFWILAVLAVLSIFASADKYPWVGVPRYVTLLALIVIIGIRVFKMSLS
jgi:hypothetical protein